MAAKTFSCSRSLCFWSRAALQAFADFGLQLVESSGVADIFGELVVEFRELFVLDAEHFDGIVIRLAGELGVGIVGGIFDVEILVVADVCAAQILVERLHGFFGADVAQHAVGLHRFAAAIGRAHRA